MRKRGKFLLLTMFILLIAVQMNTLAAGNYGDTTFKFNFSSYQPYAGWNTSFRSKLDNTSSYMKCTSTPYSYNARVMGGASTSATLGINVGSPTYRFSAGTTRFMVNYVRENNLSAACINATPSVSYSYSASGVWSPDSI